MMDNDKLEKAKQFSFDNGASEIIKRLMRKSNCSVQDLAQVLGIKPQSLSTKLYRDRFSFQEVQMIVYLLDSEVVVYKDQQRMY